MGESGMNSWGLFVMITMIMVMVVGVREGSKGLQNCDHSTHTTGWKTLLNNGIAYTPQMGYCFLSLSLSLSLSLFSFFYPSSLNTLLHWFQNSISGLSVDAGEFSE